MGDMLECITSDVDLGSINCDRDMAERVVLAALLNCRRWSIDDGMS